MAKKPTRRKKKSSPPAEDYDAIHSVADKKAPVFSTTIANTINGFVGDIPYEVIEELATAGAFDAIEFAIPFQEIEQAMAKGLGTPGSMVADLSPEAQEMWKAMKESADKTSVITTRTVREATGMEPQLAFDANNPHIRRQLNDRIGKLVTEIDASSRRNIRDVIVEAKTKELTPREISQRIKESIGLRTDQVKTLNNFRNKLLEDGQTKTQINKKVEDFQRRLMGQRTQLIARTEMMTAANEGHRIGFEQAADEGLFNRQKARMVWVTTRDDRLCATCRPMQGVPKDFDGYWNVKIRNSKGAVTGQKSVKIPNEVHPNCRCTFKMEIDSASPLRDAVVFRR